MKLLTLFIITFPLLHTLAFAENIYSIKAGSILEHNNNSTSEPAFDLSYEYKQGNYGVELGAGYYTTQLKGENFVCWDSKGEGVWRDNDKQGRLTAIPIFVTLKRYWHNFWVGIGGGKQALSFKKYFPDGNVSLENPWFFQGVIGYQLTKHWALEVKHTVANLQIESGTSQVGIAENKSNLNMTFVMVKWRF